MNIPTRKPRKYLPEDFEVKDWEGLQTYYQELSEREIRNELELRLWFRDRSELESAISENGAWRYIRMTCDTSHQEKQKAFEYFVTEIEPRIAPFNHKLNEKALQHPELEALRRDEAFFILIRNLEKEFRIFREENIPLKAKIQTESQQFGAISGAMTVEVDGKEMTLQQAAVLMQETDRELREKVYRLIAERRYQDHLKLDELFGSLVGLRNQVALNAGFSNFRDYMFTAMGRFDYGPEDCFAFHDAVEQEIVPMLNDLERERKQMMRLDSLRPWDKAVDPLERPPLKPFTTPGELTGKSIQVFNRLDPFLGECLEIMQEMGHLDLDSRKGKAPGGYNYPLEEIGVPFIFMNATSTLRDVVTLLHEGGHAVHSFLMRDLELTDFRQTPSEIAELASMSMELLTMDYWDVFFPNEEELKRAKREHLEQVIETLPWVATIDKFQHRLYENPEQEVTKRNQEWLQILQSFSDDVTDWSGLEKYREYLWHKQLHLFEVPFYYIEYGFAQLGAIAIWKNYKENPKLGLEGYLNALRLGYTRPIPEVYRAAGIRFDFSREYIRELALFVQEELSKLNE
jgi:oligoendopeptidase F